METDEHGGAIVQAGDGASARKIFAFAPVEGVSVTVRGGGFRNRYDVEWRDVRCLPSSSEADVSRNATQRAFSKSSGDFRGFVDLLQRIVLGGEPDGSKAPGPAQSGSSARDGGGEAVGSLGGGDTVLYLQKRGSRAEMQRVALKTNMAGELIEAVWTKNDKDVARNAFPEELLSALAALCASDEEGWALVRPAVWSELPAELWWQVLRRLTKQEGAAVSCSCTTICSIVSLDSFSWAPAEAPPPLPPPPPPPLPTPP